SLIVVVLIWLPFVRIADNQLIKVEAALENKGGSVQVTIYFARTDRTLYGKVKLSISRLLDQRNRD
ncbi:hypothetical protein LIR30_20320, partial [Blautia wexlerae]|uniref:hypothetical protein n=1 Tax=Blautia wexlerae TaxID=418240 RepID=UPI001D011460